MYCIAWASATGTLDHGTLISVVSQSRSQAAQVEQSLSPALGGKRLFLQLGPAVGDCVALKVLAELG